MAPLPLGVLLALGLAPAANAETGETGEACDTADSADTACERVSACLSIGPCLCGCESADTSATLPIVLAAGALVRRRRDKKALARRLARDGALAPDVAARILGEDRG